MLVLFSFELLKFEFIQFAFVNRQLFSLYYRVLCFIQLVKTPVELFKIDTSLVCTKYYMDLISTSCFEILQCCIFGLNYWASSNCKTALTL